MEGLDLIWLDISIDCNVSAFNAFLAASGLHDNIIEVLVAYSSKSLTCVIIT